MTDEVVILEIIISINRKHTKVETIDIKSTSIL